MNYQVEREKWLSMLEKIRHEQYLSRTDFIAEIGINWNTYMKLTDPEFPDVSYKTMRKIRDFIEDYERKQDE